MAEPRTITFDENLMRLGKAMPSLMPYSVMDCMHVTDWDPVAIRQEFSKFYVSTTEQEGRIRDAKNVTPDEHQDYGFFLAEHPVEGSSKRDVIGLITGHSIADLVSSKPALQDKVSERMYLIRHLMINPAFEDETANSLFHALKEHATRIKDAAGQSKYAGLVYSLPVQEKYQDLQNFIIKHGFRKLFTDRTVTPPVRYFTDLPGLPDQPTRHSDTKVEG